METGKMKLALSAGALALSMALAGCGGGGTSTNVTPPGGNGGGQDTKASCDGKGIGFNATTMRCTETCLDGYEGFSNGMCTKKMATRSDIENAASVRERGAISKSDLMSPDPTEFVATQITVARYAGDAEIGLGSTAPSPNLKFEKAPGAGSMGQAFTYTSTATDPVTERVVVYTNIEKAGEVAWNQAAIVGAGFTDFQVDGSTYVVTIPATGINARHITGDFLPGEVTSDTGENDDPIETGTAGIKGSLFGVEGTFNCASCDEITRNQSGLITVENEGADVPFTFTPTAPVADRSKLMAKYADQDDSYVSFGYWTRTPSKEGTAVTIKTFARSHDDPVDDASTVIGKATYNGAAVGRYSRIAGADTYSGDFTANATLTATFGLGAQGATAADQGVTGTISGFRSAGDAALAGLGWSLKLNKAEFTEDLSEAGLLASSNGLVLDSGTTDGGSGVPGEWSAAFAGDSRVNNQPSDIVGQFNGSFRAGRGNVAGAFGASRQQ